MPASIGSQAKLGVGATNPVTTPLEFVSESVRARKTILDTNGIRGTRSRSSERTRAGTYTVGGTIVLHPSPLELNAILGFVMGGAAQVGTPAGKTTFPLAETLPAAFFVTVDRVAKVFTYDLCKVVRARFRASEGQLLEVSLDIEGGTETVAAAGGFPALTLFTDAPFVFHDAVVTLAGATRSMKQFEVTIENVAATDRFMNSQTRAEIPVIDRLVTLQLLTPYTASETALYDQATAGASANLTLTNGNFSLNFDFPGTLQVPAVSPVVSGKGEILLELNGVARKVASTPEFSIILDST